VIRADPRPSGLRGRWGDTVEECRRLLDLANRLTYWQATGDDRAFVAPGPWRTHAPDPS